MASWLSIMNIWCEKFEVALICCCYCCFDLLHQFVKIRYFLPCLLFSLLSQRKEIEISSQVTTTESGKLGKHLPKKCLTFLFVFCMIWFFQLLSISLQPSYLFDWFIVRLQKVSAIARVKTNSSSREDVKNGFVRLRVLAELVSLSTENGERVRAQWSRRQSLNRLVCLHAIESQVFIFSIFPSFSSPIDFSRRRCRSSLTPRSLYTFFFRKLKA